MKSLESTKKYFQKASTKFSFWMEWSWHFMNSIYLLLAQCMQICIQCLFDRNVNYAPRRTILSVLNVFFVIIVKPLRLDCCHQQSWFVWQNEDSQRKILYSDYDEFWLKHSSACWKKGREITIDKRKIFYVNRGSLVGEFIKCLK